MIFQELLEYVRDAWLANLLRTNVQTVAVLILLLVQLLLFLGARLNTGEFLALILGPRIHTAMCGGLPG